MPVADHQPAAVLVPLGRERRDKGVHLRLQSLGQHPPGALPNDLIDQRSRPTRFLPDDPSWTTVSTGVPSRPAFQRRPCLRPHLASGRVRPPALIHRSQALLRTVAEQVAAAKGESRSLDFKERFDPKQLSEWLELIKDFVAIANSGGGLILVGVCDDGQPAVGDVRVVLDLDPAQITDKIESCTHVHFADFEISEVTRSGSPVAVIAVGPSLDAPIAFTRAGTYPDPGNKKYPKQRSPRARSTSGTEPKASPAPPLTCATSLTAEWTACASSGRQAFGW